MIFPFRELVAFPRCGERSSAQWLLPVPALLDDPRWQPVQVPWYGSSGRADRPCSGRTDSIYDSEPDLCKWDLDVAGDCCLVSPDQFLRQWHHFGHGSFFESLSSLTPRPILAIPFAEVPSPNPIGSPSGGSHSAPPSCSRPLSTTGFIKLEVGSLYRHLERSLSRGRNLLASGSAVPAAHYPWTGLLDGFKPNQSRRTVPKELASASKDSEIAAIFLCRLCEHPHSLNCPVVLGLFMLRFQLHHIIFGDGVRDGLGPNQPCLWETSHAGRTGSSFEKLLCRV